MLEVLAERGFPAAEVVAVRVRALGRAQARLRRRRARGAARSTDESIQGLDLALSSAGGAVSASGRRGSPRRARSWSTTRATGAWTTTSRSSSPRSTPTRSSATSGIVANPNCSTMQMVMALKPIHDAAGIERIVVSTYQSISGTGQARGRGASQRRPAPCWTASRPSAEVYPHQIAFNVLPQVETFKDGDDYTTEERKMMAETRKILADAEDLARLGHHLALLGRVVVAVLEGLDLGQHVEGDLVRVDLRLGGVLPSSTARACAAQLLDRLACRCRRPTGRWRRPSARSRPRVDRRQRHDHLHRRAVRVGDDPVVAARPRRG